MAKLKATSKTKFRHSGKTEPGKKEIFKARTTKEVRVRIWAGKSNPECAFSPLPKGAVISICDAILSKAGNTWYYFKASNGYHGFIYSGSVESVAKNAVEFIGILGDYHKYIKAHGGWFYYKFMSEITSMKKAKDRIAKKKKVGITCLVPIAWALNAMGIKRADGKIWVSGNHGSFKDHYTGGVKKKLKRVTKDGPIGYTVKEAVKKGLLKPGDIIAFKGRTHTVAFSGDGYRVYEGGHQAIKDGKYTGIKVDYENYKHRISEILRWKE